MDNTGISIAEGDILVLCIRLFTELLLGRYTLPAPSQPDTLLARHASGIFSRGREVLASLPSHRDSAFNRLLLPQAERAVTALGHAAAYACAVSSGVPAPLLRLFEVFVVKLDPLWYAEHVGVTEDALMRWEDEAVTEALPHLRGYVDGLDVRKWVTAPIVDDEKWARWLGCLPRHVGLEEQVLFPYVVNNVIPRL